MDFKLTLDHLGYKYWKAKPSDLGFPVVSLDATNDLKQRLVLEYPAYDFYTMRDLENNCGIATVIEDQCDETDVTCIMQKCLTFGCVVWIRERTYQRDDKCFHNEIPLSVWTPLLFTRSFDSISKKIFTKNQSDGLTAIFDGPVVDNNGYTFDNSNTTCPWIFTVFDGLVPAEFPPLPTTYFIIQSDIRLCSVFDSISETSNPMAGLQIIKKIENNTYFSQSLCHSIYVQKTPEDEPLRGYLTTLHKGGKKQGSAWVNDDIANFRTMDKDGNIQLQFLGKVAVPFDYGKQVDICLNESCEEYQHNYRVEIDFCIIKASEQIVNMKPLVGITDGNPYNPSFDVFELHGVVQIGDLIKNGGLQKIYKSGATSGITEGIHVPITDIFFNIIDGLSTTVGNHQVMLVYADRSFMQPGDSGGLCFTRQEMNGTIQYTAVGLCIGELHKCFSIVLPLCFIEAVFLQHGYQFVSWDPSSMVNMLPITEK